jgi:hypothetical protein
MRDSRDLVGLHASYKSCLLRLDPLPLAKLELSAARIHGRASRLSLTLWPIGVRPGVKSLSLSRGIKAAVGTPSGRTRGNSARVLAAESASQRFGRDSFETRSET